MLCTLCDYGFFYFCPYTDAAMKVTSLSVLLCLISGLVKVHSQSVPYISFNNVILPNNSYVNATALWQNGGASIQCHTDLEGQSHGDWYYPSGHKVPLPRTNFTAPLFQRREDKVIKLYRRTNYPLNTSGIYRCDIETNAVNNNSRETVYTGLYFTGGEFIHAVWQKGSLTKYLVWQM